ncbi:RNA-binding domain-containing protein [Tichowtungia aerotolerans]|uniref:Winged helix-turn-helix transcriptional regulator n=1 Tax=Tichowtungia aerotolerans TaxID=2697043 RepID=A0A6P1MBF2_9BACT|nr:RNA-binding domain-containing protein [Tichowtungia aerotolerans]QHI69874.1 winged helix-turn-helix transcriptional regulator [Tichowtungia aerotolerans]
MFGNYDTEQLRELIRGGEGLTLEFKTCRSAINRDVYDTVCAFLNRHGGIILLGVEDDGNPAGVDPTAIDQIRKDFVTAINNPQKISPPTYLSIAETELDGAKLLHVYVPESSQVHRCNGRIYDRNEDGDLDITNHTAQVARLYQRKQATYSENKVYPHIQIEDLRADLIERCRKHVRINRKNHPWVEMDDAELVKSAQLYQTDPESGKQGVTLAGVMLLGTDYQILQACPAHRTDLILRKVNVDRYDDRDLVRTNLIDSYDRILDFIRKHLPDPFYLEGTDRKSLREAIFREVASNLLIHREYASGIPARLVIEYGKVTSFNANRPHGFGALDPETFAPYPKNPVIGAFFREIDRADELGSGMRNMVRYGKTYGGTDPQLIEGDEFKMIISVPEFEEKGAGQSSPTVSGKTSGKTSGKILKFVGENGQITIPELAETIGVTERSVERAIQKLQMQGLLKRIGPAKGGRWEVAGKE